jgi:hypothetical protein
MTKVGCDSGKVILREGLLVGRVITELANGIQLGLEILGDGAAHPATKEWFRTLCASVWLIVSYRLGHVISHP